MGMKNIDKRVDGEAVEGIKGNVVFSTKTWLQEHLLDFSTALHTFMERQQTLDKPAEIGEACAAC